MDGDAEMTEVADTGSDPGLTMKIDDVSGSETVARSEVSDEAPADPSEENAACQGATTSESELASWTPVIVETPSEQASEVGDKNHPDVEILEVEQDLAAAEGSNENEEEPFVDEGENMEEGEEVPERLEPEQTSEASEMKVEESQDAGQPSEDTQNGGDLKTEPLVESGDAFLTKPDVFLYEITKQSESEQVSHKASDWNLQEPIWCGTLYAYSADDHVILKLEDENGGVLGRAHINRFPGENLFTVSDSTRFFVLKLTELNNHEKLVGLGFSSRTESADFTWTIQNHLKTLYNPEKMPPVEENGGDPRKTKAADAGFIMDNSSPVAPQIRHAPDPNQPGSSHIVITSDLPDYIKNGLPRAGIFSCHLCTASFDDMRHIKAHWFKIHKLRHPAHCVVCKRPFPTKEKMKEHRLEAHGLKCPDCGMKFRIQKILETHYMEVHGEKLSYSCPVCSRKFTNRSDLQNHVQARHKKDDGTSILKRCPHCDKVFLDEAGLENHIPRHSQFIFCHLCDKSFSTRGEIRTHMKKVHKSKQLKLT